MEDTLTVTLAETPLQEPKKLDKYSYSKISTYSQCKFKFKLNYLDKNYVYSDSIATEFGSLMHETEETIANMITTGNNIDYIALKNKFIVGCHKLALKYPEEFLKRDKSDRTYLEKMYLYLEKSIYRLEQFMSQHPKYILIGIEKKFEYDYDGVHSFSGSIDRAFYDQETDTIIIQDIKSWSKPVDEKELKAPLQFVVYTLAAEKLWNMPVDRIYCEYDLPLCDLIQKPLTANFVDDGKKELDKLFAGIINQDFKPTVSALCHWCQYNPLTNRSLLDTKPQAICPYFSTWQKSGDKVYDTLIKWQGLDTVEVDRQMCISQLKQTNYST